MWNLNKTKQMNKQIKTEIDPPDAENKWVAAKGRGCRNRIKLKMREKK